MKYTEEQIKGRIINYLTKTTKHFFHDGQNNFYKVLLFENKNGELTYVKLYLNDNRIFVKVLDKSVHNESLAELKDTLFPKWNKYTAIPYFKEARVKIGEALKLIENHDGDFKEINSEIFKILDTITYKKIV